ncbi:glycosyltransferase family 39 protein [Candidatus Borrarchaeum sp.]|uniref:ArnT family glycosyltransferase n=1 Tax=Candidatus Borrarchaeum sp. TaxID=2846742 RepID=UPI00257B30D1|nr:glycosyltransferase family 39 protein [Candidatus Borrarchaeum sp.]
MGKWNKRLVFAKQILKRLNSTRVKLFIVVLGIYLYFISGFHSANEWSRHSLIQAIVEEQTFVIDGYVKDWRDVSYYNGHYYSDKPPGLSFVGVPIYFTAKFLIEWWRIRYLLISLIAIVSALSVILVYEISGFLGGNKTSKLLTALTYAFGTITWVYSKTFFAHGFSAFLILLSIYCARLFIQENKKTFIFLSGVAMGYSFLVEYPNLLLLVPFLFYFIFYNTKKEIIYFSVPVALFLMILGIYHYVCFESPFITPYISHTSEGNMQGISTFSNPVHIGLYGLLFSPYRGLFYLSPILLLSPFGFFSLYKKYKPETVLFLSSFIIINLFYSVFIHWHGGACYGPRYLLNVIPVFTLPLFQVIEKYKDQRRFFVLFFILMGYSIFANAMGVLADYHVDQGIENPLLHNLMYLLNGGGIDSRLFFISPLTILFPIVLILICIVPTVVRRLHAKRN